ncbi:MAG: BtpA/SgcQ family protein [Planctomycetota bacterium]|jgi:membrane complex biogenesis BtpA family protein
MNVRGFLGVVHLPPLPGDPRYRGHGGFEAAERAALADAEALCEGGVDGIVVENFGSSPFCKGTRGDRLPPHQVAFLTRVAHKIVCNFEVLVGVNCLRNDARAAIGLAAAAGLAFIRVNVHTGAYVTDQGVIEGEAADTLRYRDALRAQGVRILADVLVKHSTPLAPLDPRVAARECLERGLADGVIVTGKATGSSPDPDFLAAIAGATAPNPVFIGSGLTPENVARLAPFADGAIVGTWLKADGVIGNSVDPSRVRAMADALRDQLRSG